MTERLVLVKTQLAVAEELLARAGCAQKWRPWVMTRGRHSATSIDFETLEHNAHTLDLSEEGVARIAVSLATSRRIDLHSALMFLTRDHTELVMTAVVYAAGHHQAGSRITVRGTRRQVEDVPPLAAWTNPDRSAL